MVGLVKKTASNSVIFYFYNYKKRRLSVFFSIFSGFKHLNGFRMDHVHKLSVVFSKFQLISVFSVALGKIILLYTIPKSKFNFEKHQTFSFSCLFLFAQSSAHPHPVPQPSPTIAHTRQPS